MRTVGECMQTPVVTISPDRSVEDAARRMELAGLSCLPVVESGQLVGVLTVRGILACHPNRLVADAMSSPAITIDPNASVWEARRLFLRHLVEELVVVEGPTVLGTLSRFRVETEIARYIDPLTELPRPDLLKEQAKALLHAGHELAVIFLDLDSFGMVNKLYGHILGDAVIKQAAGLLRSATDPAWDVLGRYGGDEFVIVTRRSAREARALARHLVERLSSELKAGDSVVTVSAGVAGGRRHHARDGIAPGRTLDDLMNLASLRSTQAKKEGRPVVGETTVTQRSS
ncbi:MAG: GGDEF domain-containing protein [Bacillota bacterium]